MQDLNMHMEMAHNFQLKQQQDETSKVEAKAKFLAAQAQKIAAENASGTTQNDVIDEIESESGSTQSVTTRQPKFNEKRENLPRPKITEDSNESDWAFFKAQWTRYVQGTQMSSQQQVQHLWASCSDNLQRQLHNGGATRSSTRRCS